MEVTFLLIASFIPYATPFNFVGVPDSIHSCEVGDIIQNGRVTCTCTQNYIYECVYNKTSKNVPDIPHEKLSCHPNKIYSYKSTTCICNHNNTWPHVACGEVFNSLPLRNIVKTKCKPNGYVFIGCNVCRCDSRGHIDKTRCTKNHCDDTDKSPKRRRSAKPSNVYGNCEAKNWYSLAPCQFCFCLNENKLVCNTGNHQNKKLELGTYNLSVCGKDLIREAIELIPDDDKSLRHGQGRSRKSTSPKPNTLPLPTTVETTNKNMEINIAFENKHSQETDLNQIPDNHQETASIESSSASKSVEDKREYVAQTDDGVKMESTQIPYQEDYQLNSKESKELKPLKDNSEDGTSDNEVGDTGLKIPPKPSEETLSMKNLALNLPLMLDKVFRMALRKSMVTIDKDNTCVPGSVDTVKCNSCFCLKNGKMLCTNNKCE